MKIIFIEIAESELQKLGKLQEMIIPGTILIWVTKNMELKIADSIDIDQRNYYKKEFLRR